MDDKSAAVWERRFWVVWAGGLALRLLLGLSLDLAPDEAYYWEYARHIDWSYYDHPPMVGYLIALSRVLLGDTVAAVRLPAWVGIGLLSWLLFVIGRDHLGCARTGCLAAAMPHLTPAGLALGFITTPDVPLALAWTAAIHAFLALLRGPSSPGASPGEPSDHAQLWRPWLLTGLALGLGAMSKYTMIFLVPGIAITLLAFPRLRPWVGSRRFLAMVGLAALGTVPILIWNLQHDWASLRFQFSRSFSASSRPSHANFLDFLVGQVGTIGPLLFVGLCWSGLRGLRDAWRAGDERRFFLAAAGLPMLLFFVFHGVRSKVEANWPQVAYLSLMPLAAEWLWEGPTPRRRVAWTLGVSGLLTALATVHALTLILPIPVRYDISARLHGWTQMGTALRAFDERTGRRFVFAGQGAPMAALVSFYGGIPPDRIAEIHGTGQWQFRWLDRSLPVEGDLAFVDEGRLSEVQAWLPRFHGPNASESHLIVARGRLLRTVTVTALRNSREPILFAPPRTDGVSFSP